MSAEHLDEQEDIEQRGALCLDCHHRVIWHHDERGCQYHGNGRDRCPCAISSDAVVTHLIAHNLRTYRDARRDRRTSPGASS